MRILIKEFSDSGKTRKFSIWLPNGMLKAGFSIANVCTRAFSDTSGKVKLKNTVGNVCFKLGNASDIAAFNRILSHSLKVMRKHHRDLPLLEVQTEDVYILIKA